MRICLAMAALAQLRKIIAAGLLAGALGIAASAQLNLPTGPTIVLVNVAFLIFAMSLGRMLGRGKLIRPATSQLDRV
jgi:ABC-type Mn2+/Zn2+ transport system permease subunit